jgi:UDP-glucose 4-epimerase
MKIVVVGATGNVGTSLTRLLSEDPSVNEVVGLARRRPRLALEKTTWAEADIAEDDLVSFFQGADAVVHLAWAIQPSRDPEALARVNLEGSKRVFEAIAEAGVPALVYASSVGAYSPGPKDLFVDESWPTDGVPASFYSRHKAEVERRLDDFERIHPDIRVVRLRPGLIFKREAASGVRRLFAGPLVPTSLIRPGLVPLVPDIPGLRFQAVHTADVAEAFRQAVRRDVRGAFNVAAEPLIDVSVLASIFRARPVRVSPRVAGVLLNGLWHARLQPTPAGWLDLALAVPLLDTSRARRELGWTPRVRADEALRELLDGMRRRDGDETPPLASDSGGPLRAREIASGVGERSGE